MEYTVKVKEINIFDIIKYFLSVPLNLFNVLI